jgi:hypothetical protein
MEPIPRKRQTTSSRGLSLMRNNKPVQLAPVLPTRDSRSVYVENSLNLISSRYKLPKRYRLGWIQEVEKGVWKQYGISEHHDDGKAILMACKKRRFELKQRDAA